MRIRCRTIVVGSSYPVESVPGGYPLPTGLPEGAVVKVVELGHAWAGVEFQDQSFRVFMMCLKTGHEYELPNGKWVDASSSPPNAA